MQFILLEAFILVVYCASYIGIIVVGPGYLPYYCPYHCDDRDGLSSVVLNREQMEWAQTQQHPPYVKFFRKARRLVIRADHYCFWASCFIGRRNFKFFCLFNVWGALYILGYSIWNIKGLYRLWNNFPCPYELSHCAFSVYRRFLPDIPVHLHLQQLVQSHPVRHPPPQEAWHLQTRPSLPARHLRILFRAVQALVHVLPPSHRIPGNARLRTSRIRLKHALYHLPTR